MIQEDQNQMCGNHCGGGDDGIVNRSSTTKKSKQNKVPQRGLGVAQLEKMRMKEQQKDAINFSSPSTLSPTSSTSQHSIPLPYFPLTSNQRPSKSYVHYSPPSPPPMPMKLPSPNPAFRACSLPNTAIFPLGSVPSLDPSNGDGFQVGWPSFPVHGNVSFPKMWRPNPHELSLDHIGENSAFSTSLSLPHETCNVAPFPDVLPRSTLQHEPPSSNSVVNVMSSTSVLNFPMEPPSNQSIYSNYATLWPDEEKMMVGMKRSSHFPLDNSSIPTFHSKFAPIPTHPHCRSDESTLGGNGGTTNNLDSNIPNLRETLCSSQISVEPAKSRKINGNSSEFLSLAPPPPITSSFPNSRLKQLRKLDNTPYQVSVEDSLMDSRQGNSSQPLSFFPPTNMHATSLSPPAIHCNNGVGENIDLNLKL